MCDPRHNRAGCATCGDVIESTYTHDYVSCKCGKIAVDGGQSYFRRTFKDELPVELPCDEDVENFAQEYERRRL